MLCLKIDECNFKFIIKYTACSTMSDNQAEKHIYSVLYRVYNVHLVIRYYFYYSLFFLEYRVPYIDL